MNWLASKDFTMLEKYLDVASMRQTLVSTNLANVDTPGYHTRDVNFRLEMERAASGVEADGMSAFVTPVRGLLARPDGNNVNVDRESLLLAEVQLGYKAATAILRSQFAGIRTAIREGQ